MYLLPYTNSILISLYRCFVGFVSTLLLLVLISLPCFLSLLLYAYFLA